MAKIDKEKLYRIHERAEKRLSEKSIVFASSLVSLGGETVWEDVQGLADIEGNVPLRRDSMVRLASMTKPITAAATMLLTESGKLSLDDEIDRYIPEFSAMQVSVADENGKLLKTVPAETKIQIRDLLNHTCGIVEGPIGTQAFADLNLQEGATLEKVVPLIASIPLDFQPRTQTGYSWSPAFDVMAHIIERVSGYEYEEYLKKFLFEPLEIKDIAFDLSDEQRSRLTTLYHVKPDSIERIEMGKSIFGGVPSTYKAAGAGMAATIGDYAKFAEMLTFDGVYHGRRVLSEESVRLIRTPSLPEVCVPHNAQEVWGLAVRVLLRKIPGQQVLDPGCYGWSGAYGTHFWIDPVRKLYAIYLTNNLDGGGSGAVTAREFEEDVTDAYLD